MVKSTVAIIMYIFAVIYSGSTEAYGTLVYKVSDRTLYNQLPVGEYNINNGEGVIILSKDKVEYQFKEKWSQTMLYGWQEDHDKKGFTAVFIGIDDGRNVEVRIHARLKE